MYGALPLPRYVNSVLCAERLVVFFT